MTNRDCDESTNVSESVNGQAPKTVPEKQITPLDVAKDLIPDIFALARILNWPIQGSGANFAFYRGNTNSPSLSIHEDGRQWYDYVLGQGGGPIDLLAVAENLDRKRACRRYISLAGQIQATMSHQQLVQLFDRLKNSSSDEDREVKAIEAREHREQEDAEKRDEWLMAGRLSRPGDADLEQILRIRCWPGSAMLGLTHARDLGILFARNHRSPTFVITDSSLRSAKERRLDGNLFWNDSKTKAMPGSISRWPLGASSIVRGDRVILVEGETDQLAMFALVAMFAPESLARTIVVSLSAGSLIHELALHRIQQRGNTVTLIADADDAGRKAIERWTNQLAEASVPCASASVESLSDGVKDVSDLLAKLNQFPELGARLGAWVQSIVRTGAKEKDQTP